MMSKYIENKEFRKSSSLYSEVAGSSLGPMIKTLCFQCMGCASLVSELRYHRQHGVSPSKNWNTVCF